MLKLSCVLVSASCLTLHLHLRFLRLWSEWRSCAKNGPWPGASWTMAASEWCHHTPIRCFAFVLSSERKDYTMSVWKESWMSKVREIIKNYSHDSDFFISLCSCQILNKINPYFCSAWICLSFFDFLNIEPFICGQNKCWNWDILMCLKWYLHLCQWFFLSFRQTVPCAVPQHCANTIHL